MQRSLLLAIVLIIVCSLKSFSFPAPLNGSGCLIGNRIYYSYISTTRDASGNFRYQYDATRFYDNYSGSCAPRDTKSYYTLRANSYQETSPVNGQSVSIGCGTSTVYANNTSTMYYINVINCPLDDYIWALVAALGGIGFFALRKYHLA